MRAWPAVVGLLLLSTPVLAWPTDLHPVDAVTPSLLRIDYERPWPGLPVSRGRVRVGAALPGRLWVGATARRAEAGTVGETSWGGWIALGQFVHLAADRVSQSIEGLPSSTRWDLAASGSVGVRPFAFGWSAEMRGVGSPLPATWRTWWIGAETAAARVAVGRRVIPWTNEPQWIAALTLPLPGSVRAGAAWRAGDASLGLRWVTPLARVSAATAWSGVRAGGFGFTLESGVR